LFVIPWGAHDLIGTTDTDFRGSPDDVSADRDDIDYLIDSVNWFFPRANLGTADVISTYAGLRPLVAAREDESPSAVSREEEIFESPAGLITLVGGKLTTYRSIAREITHLVAKRLGVPKARRKSDRTRAKPLPGGCSEDPNRIVDELVAGSDLTREQLIHLAQRYGSRTPEVLALAGTKEEFKRGLVPGMPDIWAEAAFAVQKEMAVRSEDILFRRTHLALKEPRESSQVAVTIREKLNLTDDQR